MMRKVVAAIALAAISVVGLVIPAGAVGKPPGARPAIGSVSAWGDNYFGELGNAGTDSSASPVATKLLPNVTQVAAGYGFSLALTADGRVWAWGNGMNTGQGEAYQTSTPVLVKSPSGPGVLSGVTQIAAGEFHALALTADGNVWAWGEGTDGQLGDGTTTNAYRPVQVKDLSNVKQVAGGHGYTSLALTADGHVWAWGSNYNGALGIGTADGPEWCKYGYDPCSTTPLEVVDSSGDGTLSGITQVAIGEAGMALDGDGAVWSWGFNGQGQLGIGTSGGYSATPVEVDLSGVRQISAGSGHNLALTSDGDVWAWGWNVAGQLGDGTTIDRYAPVQVVDISHVTTISAGYTHSLAVTDGHAWAWGQNWSGQLGDGSTYASASSPVEVENLAGVTRVAGGYNHSLAIRQQVGRPRR